MRPEDTQMASGRVEEPGITIPEEALKAAARAIGEETYVGNKQTLKDAARAACLAMLAAWPGVRMIGADDSVIYLPLPTEKPNDEA